MSLQHPQAGPTKTSAPAISARTASQVNGSAGRGGALGDGWIPELQDAALRLLFPHQLGRTQRLGPQVSRVPDVWDGLRLRRNRGTRRLRLESWLAHSAPTLSRCNSRFTDAAEGLASHRIPAQKKDRD